MRLALLFFGVYFAAFGVLMMVSPALSKRMVKGWMKDRVSRLWAPVTLAVAMLLFWASPASRRPLFILFLGALSALKAVYLLVTPKSQIEDVMAWWYGLSNAKHRLWGLASLAIGAAVLLTI